MQCRAHTKAFNPAAVVWASHLLRLLILLLFTRQSVQALDNKIYWINQNDGTGARWTFSNGSYQSGSSFYGQNPSPSVQICIGTGDFNLDGKLDSIWRFSNNGENYISLGGSDSWSLSDFTSMQPMADTNWEIVGIGYFNGTNDVSADLVWRNKLTGDNAIWFLDGQRFVSAALIQEVPDLNWKVGGTGDFNNDLFTDILWRHSTNGVNAVWFMQGTNLITTASIQSAATNWAIVGADYFNNDTKVDILWRNPSTGDNALWFMDGTTLGSTTNLPYASEAWRVCGTGSNILDTDGDGLGDVWERSYFGHLGRDGQGNLDGDSYSDSYEYSHGTDPTRRDDNQGLQDGLDSSSLSFTYSGSGSWSCYQIADFENWENPPFWASSPYNSYALFDGDCVGSPDCSQGESSSIQTTLVGPGTLLFRWAAISASDEDRLTFYIDDVSQAWTATSGWQTRKHQLSSGSHTLRWTWAKTSDQPEEANYHGLLDHLEFYPPGTGSSASLGDALENTAFEWSTTGSPGWAAQTDVYSPWGGGDSAQAGGNGSTLSVTGTVAGFISFQWKAGDTQLAFLTNNVACRSIGVWGGSTDWIPVLLQLPSSSSIKWEGSGSCWVDNVTYYPDGDHDGMPDQWETEHFGSSQTQDGTTDYDADGVSDLAEFWNGTNPTLAELRVKIATPRKYSLLP